MPRSHVDVMTPELPRAMGGLKRIALDMSAIVELCVGAYMLRPGWCAAYTPGRFRDLVPRRLMVAWGYVWAVAMFALAGSNFLVEQVFGQRIWAAYVSLSPMVLIVVLSAAGIPLFVVTARKNSARIGQG